MKTRIALLLPFALGALLACGDDDGPKVSYSDWAEAYRGQVDTVCECYDELGFDNRSGCVAGQERIGPSQEQCARDAIADDATAFRIFSACLLPLQRDFTDCVDEQLECGDVTSLETCSEDFAVGLRECDSFSAAVRRALDSCGVELVALDVRSELCDDSCRFANDDACDDGGPDAEFMECDLGTDCSDCGPR